VSQLRSWVNAPSPNRFSGLWLLNYAPGWPTPRRTSDAARPRPSAARPYRSERAHSPLARRWRVAKVVSAQSLTESLTTFGDLYREALPEERRELIRLRVNQLIWTPDEIRLALLDQPEACQELVESQHLVAQRLDSLNHPASGISSIFIKDIGGTPRSSASAVGTVLAASKQTNTQMPSSRPSTTASC